MNDPINQRLQMTPIHHNGGQWHFQTKGGEHHIATRDPLTMLWSCETLPKLGQHRHLRDFRAVLRRRRTDLLVSVPSFFGLSVDHDLMVLGASWVRHEIAAGLIYRPVTGDSPAQAAARRDYMDTLAALIGSGI